MNILVLMGSPRLHGNTAELLKPMLSVFKDADAAVRYVTLAEKHILPCLGCYACQDVAGEYGCAQRDDMHVIAADMQWADLIVLTTPIYSWYCTAQMKAVLDRHYGMNKYYGSASGSLWAGKRVAIVATHGYEDAYATEPFETGVKRLCIHSKLEYVGMYSVQDEDNLASFRTPEAVDGAKAFAQQLLGLSSLEPQK